MKKALRMICAGLLLLTGCQPTPEQPVVEKKDTEQMLEQAQGEASSSGMAALGVIEEKAVYEAVEADGMLKISADAKVTLPDAEKMPVKRVTQGVFTQEQVTAIFNYFYPEEKPLTIPTQVETKKDFDLSIIELKRQYGNGEYEGTDEEYAEELALLEKLRQTAPESQPGETVSDGTLQPIMGNILYLAVHDDSSELNVTTIEGNTLKGDVSTSTLSVLSYRGKNYSERNMVSVAEADLSKANAAGLTITCEQAQEVCAEFLKTGGFPAEEFFAEEAFLVDDTGADEIPGENYAYLLRYARKTDRVKAFSCPDMISIGYARDETQYAAPWSYEYLEIIVDNDGIQGIDWYDPVEIGETVEEDATLLPFSRVMEKYAEMAKTTYAPLAKDVLQEQYTVTIHAESAELMLLRVREQNGSGTEGLLVPAWIFHGSRTAEDDQGNLYYICEDMRSIMNLVEDIGGISSESGDIGIKDYIFTDREKHDSILVAINAIDGSVIDLSKGY